MGFSRQGYWSGLHFFLQGIFLTRGMDAGIELTSPALQVYSATEALGKPLDDVSMRL